MKRPNSTTLRRHAGFIKAGKIEKERKKIRKEFALMRTEQKKFYKVVVVVDDVKGQLGQTAFEMDQSSVMLPQPGAPMPEAPFDPGRFSVDQITVGTGGTFGPRLRFSMYWRRSQCQALC